MSLRLASQGSADAGRSHSAARVGAFAVHSEVICSPVWIICHVIRYAVGGSLPGPHNDALAMCWYVTCCRELMPSLCSPKSLGAARVCPHEIGQSNWACAPKSRRPPSPSPDAGAGQSRPRVDVFATQDGVSCGARGCAGYAVRSHWLCIFHAAGCHCRPRADAKAMRGEVTCCGEFMPVLCCLKSLMVARHSAPVSLRRRVTSSCTANASVRSHRLLWTG